MFRYNIRPHVNAFYQNSNKYNDAKQVHCCSWLGRDHLPFDFWPKIVLRKRARSVRHIAASLHKPMYSLFVKISFYFRGIIFLVQPIENANLCGHNLWPLSWPIMTKVSKLQYQLHSSVDIYYVLVHHHDYQKLCFCLEFITNYSTDHVVFTPTKWPHNKMNFSYVRRNRIHSACRI